MAAMIRLTEEMTTKKTAAITCVFLDIGGVLHTDGCSPAARRGEYASAMERT
jgi:hypothetical protein